MAETNTIYQSYGNSFVGKYWDEIEDGSSRFMSCNDFPNILMSSDIITKNFPFAEIFYQYWSQPCLHDSGNPECYGSAE